MKKMFLPMLGLAAATNAHTLFTTFFVNGQNQGDGTCVREPKENKSSTAPIYPITGDDIACGMYLQRLMVGRGHANLDRP